MTRHPCGARLPLGLAPLKPDELTQLRNSIELDARHNWNSSSIGLTLMDEQPNVALL